jgi:hypothetical protein
MEWGSLLKEWITSERERATMRGEQLDGVELLLNQERVAKELYATTEAHGEANIKVQEDLNK